MERGLVFFNMWCFHLRSAQCCQLTHFLPWTETNRLRDINSMYKKGQRMTEIYLKFAHFYLPNEEIQSRKIQNNIYFEFSCSGFPRLQDKRAETLCWKIMLACKKTCKLNFLISTYRALYKTGGSDSQWSSVKTTSDVDESTTTVL